MLASDRTAPADLKRRHQPSKDATGGS
jgi:hypothetical protein